MCQVDDKILIVRTQLLVPMILFRRINEPNSAHLSNLQLFGSVDGNIRLCIRVMEMKLKLALGEHFILENLVKHLFT